MTRASIGVSSCAALVALGTLVACGDDVDGPADAGRRDSGESSDGGQDAGPTDADAAIDDAGAGPARLRLAHLMPGAPSIHICLHAVGVSSALLITQSAPAGVPYRGISSYVASLRPLPILHGIRVYDAADITSGACPVPGAATPVPLIDEEVDWGATFTGGSLHTIAAIGLPEGEDASAPHLLILEDDLTPPAAGQARVRLVHTIPNLPPSVPSVDVCFDSDGPGAVEAVELFDGVSFEDATDYLERAPITRGVVSMHVHNPEGAPIPDCLAMRPPDGTMLLQAPVPFPVPSGAGIPPNLVDTFDEDTIDSAFIVGDATKSPVAMTACSTDAMCEDAIPEGQTCNTLVGVCTHPLGPTLIPWQDDLGLP